MSTLIAIVATILLTGMRAGALDLELVDRSTILSGHKFIDGVMARIPRAIRDLKVEVRVQFSKFDERPSLLAPGCERQGASGNQLLGHTKRTFGGRYIIKLNKNFLPYLRKPEGEEIYKCGHKNPLRWAQATLIHELFHVWDAESGISKRPQFRALVGFFGGRSRNIEPVRTEDFYGNTNASEALATAGEYYVLDPYFVVRRPAVTKFLDQMLQETKGEKEIIIPLPVEKDEKLTQLRPERIYRIDYLKAGRGKAFISKFGHSALLLNICDPSRTEVGPECLKDHKSHLVVSFLAETQLDHSARQLLSTQLPSFAYVYRPREIIESYLRTESRELVQYPLKLSKEEIQMFGRALGEYFWSFVGKYKFLRANCATYILNILQSSTSRQLNWPIVVTPSNLLDSLLESGLVGREEWTATLGRPSNELTELGFKKIKAAYPALFPTKLTEYEEKLSALQRRNIWTTAGIDSLSLQQLAALSLIESQILRTLSYHIETGVMHGQSKELLGDSQIENIRLLKLTPSSYGIPVPDEYAEVIKVMDANRREMSRIGDQLLNYLSTNFPDLIAEVKRTEENLNLLRLQYKRFTNQSMAISNLDHK